MYSMRELCANMSKRCNLLILISVCSSLAFAQLWHADELTVTHMDFKAKPMQTVTQFNHSTEWLKDSNMHALIETELYKADQTPTTLYVNQKRAFRTYNRWQLRLGYKQDENKYFQLGYRNQINRSQDITPYFATIDGGKDLNAKNWHNFSALTRQTYNNISFEADARFKTTSAEVSKMDEFGSTGEMESTRYSEMHFDGKIGYQVMEEIQLYATIVHKDDLDLDHNYDLDRFGVGVSFDKKLDYSSSLSASSEYQSFDCDFTTLKTYESYPYGNERKHYFYNQIRYQKSLGTNVNGFVTWMNRSVYDTDGSQMRVISNYIRGQLKYTLPFDVDGESFVLALVKYSPENKATVAGAEINMPVVSNWLYLNAGDHYAPDYSNDVKLGAELFFTKLNSFYIQATSSKLVEKHQEHETLNFYTMGTRFFF